MAAIEGNKFNIYVKMKINQHFLSEIRLVLNPNWVLLLFGQFLTNFILCGTEMQDGHYRRTKLT